MSIPSRNIYVTFHGCIIVHSIYMAWFLYCAQYAHFYESLYNKADTVLYIDGGDTACTWLCTSLATVAKLFGLALDNRFLAWGLAKG